VFIRNTGTMAAQVISRTWHINDANGLHEKVRGLGVVGHQPLLQPGESFEYTSGTRLRTPTGTMHGSYFCVAVDGEKFDVDIPMFVLDALSDSARHLH
jgi:ApaG protein